jgi:hypothetical protein
MSLRDRWRSRRADDLGGDGAPSAGRGDGGARADLFGAAELSEFGPRQDGDYRCTSAGLFLRFARPIVTETTVPETAGAADYPATGEFTTSGRFTVQRPFGRPIVYTVLGDDADGPAAYDEMLVVRRTDTGTRTTDRLEFTFEPDVV